jgi:WD40 repeat protein
MSTNTIYIWDWVRELTVAAFPSNTASAPTILKFLTDGRLAAQTQVSQTNIWNLTTGLTDLSLPTWAVAIEQLAGGDLATASAENYIRIWSLIDGTNTHSMATSSYQTFLRQSSLTNYLASSDASGTIYIWDLTLYSLAKTLTGHTNQIVMLESLSNGNLVSASLDGYIKIWNVLTAVCLNTYTHLSINGMKLVDVDTIAIAGDFNYVLIIQINATSSQFKINKTISIPTSGANDVRVNGQKLLLIALYGSHFGIYNLTSAQYLGTTVFTTASYLYMLEVLGID